MAQHDFDAQNLDHLEDYPVDAAVTIGEGEFVSVRATGYLRPLNGSDVFVGVAARAVVNPGAAGLVTARVLSEALIRGAAVTGAALTTPPGTPVYAASATLLTLSASTGLLAGVVVKGLSTNKADVFLQSEGRRVPASD